MLVLLLVSAWVSEDWALYRAGARDCKFRAVDPVSSVVVYGGYDCSPKKAGRKMVQPPLAQELAVPGGRIVARVVSDAPASGPTAGLSKLFPGPATLRVLRIGDDGSETLLAETMGTPREILGLARHKGAVLVVFTYEKTLRESPKDPPTAVDVLGLDLSASIK